MVKKKELKNQKKLTSAARKAKNSSLWRERAQAIKIIDENATVFIAQENVRIIKLDESKRVEMSFSAIVSSKGKIVID